MAMLNQMVITFYMFTSNMLIESKWHGAQSNSYVFWSWMAGALPLHYRRGKMIQLIRETRSKTIQRTVNSEKRTKDPTHQLMAHHLCRIQEPLDLRTKATPCIQQRQTPQTHTNSRRRQCTAVHPLNRSNQALALTKARTASIPWGVVDSCTSANNVTSNPYVKVLDFHVLMLVIESSNIQTINNRWLVRLPVWACSVLF
jgi:hypothetical protein